jgi:hypothetical protein
MQDNSGHGPLLLQVAVFWKRAGKRYPPHNLCRWKCRFPTQNTLHFFSFGIIIASLNKSTLPSYFVFQLQTMTQTMTKGGVDAQR